MGNLFVFKKEGEKYFPGNILQKKSGISKTFLNLVAILAFNSIDAQTIKWDFDGGAAGTNAPSTTISNVTVSDLLQRNNNGNTTLITSVSSSSGYSGASGNFNAGAAAISAPFDKSTSTYFEFTLTPDQGYGITVTAINFGSRSTGTGPQSYAIRSSLDSYNSDIGANSLPADSKWYLYQHSGLSVLNTSPITFRIYGYNGVGASSNVAVWRIDDLSLQGTASPLQTYYRSRQTGNWSVSSSWEFSYDNTNWNNASSPPTKDADKILIQAGHTIIVNSPVSLDQTTISGTMQLQTGGILAINDGTGDDITILENGILQITSTDDYVNSVMLSNNANFNIATNGKIEIGDGNSFTGNGYENFATSLNNVWNDRAIYEYNNNGIFQIADLTYFPNSPSTDIPIFRVIKANGTAAVGYPKEFHLNGLLEFLTDINFSGSGKKYFRNGIHGNGTITTTGSGKIYLENQNSVLDGAPMNLILSAVMDLAPQTIVPIGANVTISGANLNNNVAGNVFTINGTLDVTDQGIKNTNGKIILNGIFRTKIEGGFSGSGSSIVSGNIIVNPGSNIELYANGAQSLNARNDFSNIIFSGSGTKTPNGPFSPSGTITIKDDAIFDCTGNINGINIGNDNTNLTMTGNSRLIVSTYGPNPKMGGIYNLSGGVIEFRGLNGTAQNIRSKNYQNIEVTGNNVLMSDGNIWLNTNGTFTVKNGGVFSINDNTIRGIGDATQTIIVESGGVFKCGTNMGFNGAAITSIPIKSSSINEDIKNIILQPGSTVDYTRNGDQPITNANGLVYQNLVISGTGNKIAPTDDLTIKGNLSKTSIATFLHNNGTVIFNSTIPQNYSSASPQVIFNNLTNKNTSGLNINDSLSVYKHLMFENNSVIKLNADISLLSSKVQTASIGRFGINAKINYGLGRFIIERYINTNTLNGGHPKSWQLISTPAFGETIFDTWQEKGNKAISGYGTWITDKTGTANGFDATSAAPSIKYFDALSDSYVGIPGTYINLENEKGYMIFIRGDRNATSISSPATPTVLRTRGKIYTPDFLPPVSTVSPGKFQSIGNPYASVIDFSTIYSSNIGSYYTAWDPTLGGNYGVGGYQTISEATGYKPVPGNSVNYNSSVDYKYIQSGQSFFVFNNTASLGSVSFSEDCKMSGNNYLVTRKGEQANGILFANLISQNDILIDGNAVSFSSKFSNKIDSYDALKFLTAAPMFCLKRSEKLLSVEARNEIAFSDTIFYSLGNLSKQPYKLSFISENIKPGFRAVLIDAFLKTETYLSLTDTSIVPFIVTDDKNSAGPNRFYLIFRAATPLDISFLSMNAYPKEGNVLIAWKTENENEVKNYGVEYSPDGINFSEIGSVIAKNEKENNYEFFHLLPSAGNNFYRIRINKINGEVEYKRVLKVWMPESKSSIGVFPNPIQNGIITLKFNNQSSGKYVLSLFNSMGQKIFSNEIFFKEGGRLEPVSPGKGFIRGIYNLEIVNPKGKRTILKIAY